MRAAALKLSQPDDKNKYYARRLFIFMGTETAALVQARERVNRIIQGEIANFDKLTFNTPFSPPPFSHIKSKKVLDALACFLEYF